MRCIESHLRNVLLQGNVIRTVNVHSDAKRIRGMCRWQAPKHTNRKDQRCQLAQCTIGRSFHRINCVHGFSLRGRFRAQ